MAVISGEIWLRVWVAKKKKGEKTSLFHYLQHTLLEGDEMG